LQGSDILLDQTEDIGKLACQFGTERLARVLTSTLETVAKQHPDTLANLPAFADILAGLDSKTLDVSIEVLAQGSGCMPVAGFAL
jgi:hypothetical protein